MNKAIQKRLNILRPYIEEGLTLEKKILALNQALVSNEALRQHSALTKNLESVIVKFAKQKRDTPTRPNTACPAMPARTQITQSSITAPVNTGDNHENNGSAKR